MKHSMLPLTAVFVISFVASTNRAIAQEVSDPSAQRVASVRAIEKPQTQDVAADEYSYGFRLWEAKLYSEAQQQLKLYLSKYPKHAKGSFARNLLGRVYLESGNPREAAAWFLQNYKEDPRGARAADSILFLAEAMRQMDDKARAQVALDQFNLEFRSTTPRLEETALALTSLLHRNFRPGALNEGLKLPAEPTEGKAPVAVSVPPRYDAIPKGFQAGISEAKRKCSDLGFTPDTEAFGKCVLKVSE